MRWLELFQRCFGHRAQRLALRTYVQGVFSDSDRKSMQAMLARVTEPVSYQAFSAFHHARAVGCRSDLAPPVGNPARASRRADHRRHQLSETGAALGWRGTPVLRGALGEIRELPGRGDRRVVDGHTCVVAGRVAVSAASLERGCAPTGGDPHSIDGVV